MVPGEGQYWATGQTMHEARSYADSVPVGHAVHAKLCVVVADHPAGEFGGIELGRANEQLRERIEAGGELPR